MEALYQPFPFAGTNRAQIWRHAPAYHRPRHFHAEPELNIVCAGRGAFAYGERVVGVGPGDLLWWAPGQDHELVDASPDFDLFVLAITPALSERVLGSVIASSPSGHCRMPLSMLSRWRQACSFPFTSSEPTWKEQHVAELWLEAVELRRQAADPHVLTRKGLVRLSSCPSLERAELARELRTDPSELSRYFRRDTGLSFSEYRTRLRLVRCIEAVDCGATSLLAAALSAGFGSYSQCHRSFVATLGLTPRDFFSPERRRAMTDRLAPW
jgi:AraC-like DNA-binding protein